MKRNLLAVLILIIATVAVMVGCTESFKQDAVAGDYANLVVESNGGLAVKANNYIFYINGYAGETGDNVFGEAVKGAIVRAELKDGVIDPATIVTVVPKNVYGTVKTSGIFIVGDYLYYTCPSTQKDSKGEYKTTKMVLLRTSLDGAKTDEIITFDDYTPTFKVGANAVMYYNSTDAEIHTISLVDKKDFEDTVVAENVTGCVFSDTNATSALNEWAFYSKAATDADANYNEVYKTKLDGAGNALLMDGLNSYPEALRAEQIYAGAVEKGFTLSLSKAMLTKTSVRLIYTKTDKGSNTLSQGIYMSELDETVTFDSAKETRLSTNGKLTDADDVYTDYLFIDDNNVLATAASSLQWLTRPASGYKWTVNKRADNTQAIPSATTVLKYQVANQKGTLYYLNGTKVQVYNLLAYDANGAITGYADENSVDFISTLSVATSWLPAEVIGNNLIYWDSGVSNYTYTINFGAVTMSATKNIYDQDTVKTVLISKVTDVDRATLAA